MKEYEQKIDALGETYLVKKAPFQLPVKFKDFIVRYGPYISAFFLILSLPAVLSLVGIGAFLSPVALMAGVKFGFSHYVSVVISIATLVLSALAIPGLLKRQLSGWRLAWYSAMITAVGNVIRLDVLGLIIGLLISMYFLYQIKSYYK